MKITHFFSMGNHVGDWIYAFGQQSFLRSQIPNVEIEQFTLAANHGYDDDPGITAERLGNCDLAIIGGGPVYYFREPGAWRCLIGDPTAVLETKTPILIWNTGFDVPFKWVYDALNDVKFPLIKALHETAPVAAVRDEPTHLFLQELGFPSIVTGDAAHFIPTIKQEPEYLSFVYRSDMAYDCQQAIIAWYKHFSERFHIKIICMSPGDYDPFIQGLPNADIYVSDINVLNFLQVLTKSIAVVSFRMHAAIPAVVNEIPTVLYWNGTRGYGWSEFANRKIDLDISHFKHYCIESTEHLLLTSHVTEGKDLQQRVLDKTTTWWHEVYS